MSGLSSNESVGIIIARFQVPELHQGHRFLVEEVAARHRDVLIFLGTRGTARTRRDPLTFQERAIIVHEAFPERELALLPLPDHPISNAHWSTNIDACIREAFPNRHAILYGSRQSFIPLYVGDFSTYEIPAIPCESGTDVRTTLTFPHTRDARAAIIHAIEHGPSLFFDDQMKNAAG